MPLTELTKTWTDRSYFWPVVFAAIIAVTSPFITVYMVLASIAFYSMLLGFILRKRAPKAHLRFMGFAMALDLALVLTLELQRDAVGTALSFTLNPWQQAHIATSSIATALYFPMIALGALKFTKYRGYNVNHWHKILGIACMAARGLGYLLMFSMLSNHK